MLPVVLQPCDNNHVIEATRLNLSAIPTVSRSSSTMTLGNVATGKTGYRKMTRKASRSTIRCMSKHPPSGKLSVANWSRKKRPLHVLFNASVDPTQRRRCEAFTVASASPSLCLCSKLGTIRRTWWPRRRSEFGSDAMQRSRHFKQTLISGLRRQSYRSSPGGSLQRALVIAGCEVAVHASLAAQARHARAVITQTGH